MSKELDVAVKAAKAAGEILMQNFGKKIRSQRKSSKELVTPVDVECEKKILSILKADFPDYNIWSEEMGSVDNESNYRWIVDPLDGTHNFLFGLTAFGVSIALEKKEKVQAGVMFLPFYKQLFTAERGKGAFLNGSRIHVSRRKMADALINVCPVSYSRLDWMKKMKIVREKAFSQRNFGAAVSHLSTLALGIADAVIEFHEKPGDYAAGWLLVEEAGGKFTAFDGGQFSMGSPMYIASNGVFHDELVEIMRRGKK